jgi:protein transport protein SEC61 subunit alpha
LIILQLFFAGIIVICLDELLQKGYGLGSGISLFIATNICETIVWKSFSPTTINTGRGTEFEGALVAFFHLVVSRPDKWKGVKEAFYRQNLPNLTNLMSTVLIFLVVIYFQGFRVDLPVKYRSQRGMQGSYPIKLFYTSNMPIMLLSALTSSLYFFSQITYKKYAKNAFIRLLGIWEETPGRGYRPVWGLAYLLSPPKNLVVALLEPVHTLFYFAFMIITCALLAGAWCEIMAQQSPGAVAEQFKERTEGGQKKRLFIYTQEKGSLWTKNAGYKELKDKIRTAAALGGMALACLSVSADLLGAIGSGSGVLMAVTIIYELYEKTKREFAMEGGAAGFLAQMQIQKWARCAPRGGRGGGGV